jgi:hypothetical protein
MGAQAGIAQDRRSSTREDSMTDQRQQQEQRQGGQRQSQQQGRIPSEKISQTTADPGADGQSVYDLQDAETREREDARPVPPWKLPPDSNAM